MKINTLRRCLVVTGFFASCQAMAGPYAPPAGEAGSTAIHMDDTAFISWATGIDAYTPGLNVDTTWQTPVKALGKAKGDSFDIVSLGAGGQITLTFDDPIVNGAGDDFAVFENSINATFLELAIVQVSSDGNNFFSFDVFSQTANPVNGFGVVDATDIDGFAGKYSQGWGTPFDLDELSGISGLDINAVSYVRLLDVIGDGSMLDNTPAASGGPNPIYDPYQTFGSAGFDLDAIGVIHSASAVPVPASIWLLGSGLVALVSIRKRTS